MKSGQREQDRGEWFKKGEERISVTREYGDKTNLRIGAKIEGDG